MVKTLFADGQRWIRGRLVDQQGNRCLVGGLQYVREHHQIDWRSVEETERCLVRALRKHSNRSLIAYNDSSSFSKVRALILSARQLAASDIEQAAPAQPKQRRAAAARATRKPRNPQWHAPTITEGDSVTEPESGSLAKLAAAEERKRTLLAEIELERVARAAKGDFRATYILCPEPVKRWRVEKMVEAHAVPPSPPAIVDALSPATGFASIEAVPAR